MRPYCNLKYLGDNFTGEFFTDYLDCIGRKSELNQDEYKKYVDCARSVIWGSESADGSLKDIVNSDDAKIIMEKINKECSKLIIIKYINNKFSA